MIFNVFYIFFFWGRGLCFLVTLKVLDRKVQFLSPGLRVSFCSASWKPIMTVLFYFCSTELSCFSIHVVKRFATFSPSELPSVFMIRNKPLLAICFALVFILSPSSTYNWICFPLSQSGAVRTHFLDILLASLAIHKFQNIRPRSLPIFNTMQNTRPFCHSFIFSFFRSLKYDPSYFLLC